MTPPVLTLVVPAYNSEAYLERCVDSLLAPAVGDVEIVIVDDGSTDRTGEIADRYQRRAPELVTAVHQTNGGHGAAINTGLARARGVFFKVVDSDDWLDSAAFRRAVAALRRLAAGQPPVDLVVTNFVYENSGRRRKRVVDYRSALPVGREFGWDEVGQFRLWQYLLMHSLTYRTALLRDCGLKVPERSFYVDNYFAFAPLPAVARLAYLDVDLYRYFIGRADQSVNEQVMISRIDQQVKVNLLMVAALSRARAAGGLASGLDRYMTRYAALVSTVSSTLLARAGTAADRAKSRRLWREIEAADPALCADLRRVPVARLAASGSLPARWLLRRGYDLARWLVGFN
ncbi:MAG: glycosyltransferase family 2 protein [Propionibacteriaceae bacterium]|jgi:glycosyltransferase involved in cell wall biosynthesis|nr:glycosyltransferase family 2 protein [Propionibacteriaceae bacterium]